MSRESPDCPALGVAKPVSSEFERVWVPTEEGPAAGRHESINALPRCARSPISCAKRPPLRKTYRPPRSCPSRSLQVGTRTRAQPRALHFSGDDRGRPLRGAPTGRRPTECPYRVNAAVLADAAARAPSVVLGHGIRPCRERERAGARGGCRVETLVNVGRNGRLFALGDHRCCRGWPGHRLRCLRLPGSPPGGE